MTPIPFDRLELHYLRLSDGSCPVQEWLDSLDAVAWRRVVWALDKVEAGNLRGCRSIQGVQGLFEIKAGGKGPGYRIYFGRENRQIVILLCVLKTTPLAFFLVDRLPL